MDLTKSAKLFAELRKANGMTQKDVAQRLGVLPKTISKWETGKGFPDISLVSSLADIFGVSIDAILTGNLDFNTREVGNMKNTKFYVCPCCGAVLQGTGECDVVCCGKQLVASKPHKADQNHALEMCEVENDFYITFNHEMTKEHYIEFVSYVAGDRVLTVRLYPEQDSSLRIPRLFGGKFYYYCNKHGLFEFAPQRKSK